MTMINWAHHALAPKVIDLRISNQTRTGGASLTGFEQVNYAITQRWAASLEFNNLKRQTIPAYRAMIAALQGRANVLRVPVFDQRFWPSDAVLGLGEIAFSDGGIFSDGGEFITNDIEGITATGLKGEKSISIDFGDFGEVISGGLYFGIDDQTYLAIEVDWTGSVAAITFEPSLRKDYTAGMVKLRPICLMRLANDEVGSHPLDMGIVTAPSLALTEILPDELDLLEAMA